MSGLIADYKGNRRWTRKEVEAGVYMSLAQDTPDGIKEVTSRKFLSFELMTEHALGFPVIGGYSTSREFTGPFIFDALVFSRKPAGGLTDICWNTHRQNIEAGVDVSVVVKWNGERVNKDPARADEKVSAKVSTPKRRRWRAK